MKVTLGNIKAAFNAALSETKQLLPRADEHTLTIVAYFALGLTGREIKTALICEGYEVDTHKNYFSACKHRYSDTIKKVKAKINNMHQTEAIKYLLSSNG